MSRSFRPTLSGLEPRQLLTTISPPPVHQASHNLHTGSILGGQVTLESVDAGTDSIDASSTSTTYTGAGLVRIAGRNVQANITITLADDQSFMMTIDDGLGDVLHASGLSLADGTAGNYRITDTSGAWAAVHGTGVWFLNANDDGDAVFSLNPHQ